MSKQPHTIPYRNQGYDPHYTKSDVWARCRVCGWWNDVEITSEPINFGGISVQTTGSVWYTDIPGFPDVGVEGLAQKDKQTEAVVGGGCRLCGSGNWLNANGLEGLAPP